MDVLAAFHVATGIEVRAVAQGGVCPGEYQPLEVQFVTCEGSLMCSAGTATLAQQGLGVMRSTAHD